MSSSKPMAGTGKSGWCITGHHRQCPYYIGPQRTCTCTDCPHEGARPIATAKETQ